MVVIMMRRAVKLTAGGPASHQGVNSRRTCQSPKDALIAAGVNPAQRSVVQAACKPAHHQERADSSGVNPAQRERRNRTTPGMLSGKTAKHGIE